MEQQSKYTNEQLITLLWLKVLDKLDEGTVKGLSFEEKYTMFDTSDLSDISQEDFVESVDFWIDEGIFDVADVDGEMSISFTAIGKQLFDKLSEDSTIAELEEITSGEKADTKKPKKDNIATIKNFVIEHRNDIGSFIGSVIGEIIKTLK